MHWWTRDVKHSQIVATTTQVWPLGTLACKVQVYCELQMLITLGYARVSWKNTTLDVNLVLIRVFNFFFDKQASTHAFCHSSNPFFNFLVQVMVFWKENCAPFKLTSFVPRQTWSWLVAYWHALDKTCLKHVLR